MNVAAIIQARMGSSRLPGKVMLGIGGLPVIELIVRRLEQCRRLQRIVVATSTAALDDELYRLLCSRGIVCCRGSETDVLDRYYRAAAEVQADAVVRVTGDCPFVEPELVDRAVEHFLCEGALDYVSNIDPPTYPDGLDVEVLSFSALLRAWREAEWTSEREHVTPYVRKHPERFPQANIRSAEDLSGHRWTLDEEKDYRFLLAVTDRLQGKGIGVLEARMEDVLRILRESPELAELNGGITRNEGAAKSALNDRRADGRGGEGR
jgi:spore coat polysaccharide biosynthesis protein SpsF (cytidylyltransferase family)